MLIRPARVLVRTLVSALAALALAGCIVSDPRPLYRCLESVTTESLTMAAPSSSSRPPSGRVISVRRLRTTR